MKHAVKYIIGKVAALAALLLALPTCTQEERETDLPSRPKGSNENLTVVVAKQWFEHRANGAAYHLPATRSTNGFPFGNILRPWYAKGREATRTRYETVEFPLLLRGGQVMIDNETRQRWNPEIPDPLIRNNVKLVILYDRQKRKTRCFIMVFVGTYDYLHNNSESFGLNSYLYRQADFSGHVFFYNLKGKFLNGWEYADGEIKATLSPKMEGMEEFTSKDSDLSPLTRAASDDCMDLCTYTLYNACYEEGFTYTDPELGPGFGVAAGCVPVTVEHCTVRCDHGSGGGEPSGGSSGKGGGGWSDDNPSGGVIDDGEEVSQEKTEKLEDPCSKAFTLSLDEQLREKADKLYDENLTAKSENGWLKTKDGEYVLPEIKDNGSVRYTPSQTPGKLFVENFHSHPPGQGCITSDADLTKRRITICAEISM